jgi:hypothetical protein
MYGKLFAQMFDGTLATKGPWQALVTFQQLIILADQHGVVEMTPEAIARRTTIPLEIIQQGIKALLEPDPDSRSPAENGRRIKPLDEVRSWGWQIVNYEHYRNIRSQEERRAYHRQYYYKRKTQQHSTVSTDSTKAVSSMHKHKQEGKEEKQGRAIALPDWLPAEPWEAWLETRRRMKAPNTERALKLAIRDLEKYRAEGQDPGGVLDQSTKRGWRGLFPVSSTGAVPDYSGVAANIRD